jgi:hypothetical protein
MEFGLLWYDRDPKRALEDKIGQAAQRYRQKYGRWPNTCYVHPLTVADVAGDDLRLSCQAPSSKATIQVVSAPNILLHHYWLGESSDPIPEQNRAAAN